MNIRRRARELALQALFQFDVQGEPFAEELDGFLRDSTDQLDVRHFARKLAHGAWERRAEADAILNKLTVRWSIDRMAIADRNILRMGIYQLLHCPEIPARVVINEAIELGKRYSTVESPQFINGLLDAANKDIGRKEPEPSAELESVTETAEEGDETADDDDE
ncbi:MAG: transcription antitermination factor NusB [Phycisphaerae bacterium]|nr:transcription antitermination factor NusB [Phycisphaerae bacterium]